MNSPNLNICKSSIRSVRRLLLLVVIFPFESWEFSIWSRVVIVATRHIITTILDHFSDFLSQLKKKEIIKYSERVNHVEEYNTMVQIE